MPRWLLVVVLLCAPALTRAEQDVAVSTAETSFPTRRDAALKALRAWFMDDEGKLREPEIAFSTSEESAHAGDVAAVYALDSQVRLLRRGRDSSLDDWQSYSDMAALLARRLGIEPAEKALPVYRGRVCASTGTLSAAEKSVHDELAAQVKAPGILRRYWFVPDLIGAPPPPAAGLNTRVVYVRGKRGKRIKKVIEPPELAPLPRGVSVIAQIDWQKADELAEVADDNAHGWDRRPKESLRRYRRRLRRLRARCYEWVRRDLEALGIWDAQLFRGYVPPTRRDRKRPIRAASFALAMAKIEASDRLAARTSLRELDLRVDPLVRGAIVVFAPRVCDYSPRNGHIEVITSVDPLQAASYKFHPVKPDCLVKAANENKMHVYVPLRTSEPHSESGR